MSSTRGNNAQGTDARGKDARGKDARGNDARGNDARGNDARGNDARGNDARGNDVQGEAVHGQAITFSPAIQGTDDLVTSKLRFLRELLEDDSFEVQRHRENILFLIHYYENGGEPPPRGQRMWLVDGKVVNQKPVFPPMGSAIWPEEGPFPQQLGQSFRQSSPSAF